MNSARSLPVWLHALIRLHSWVFAVSEVAVHHRYQAPWADPR